VLAYHARSHTPATTMTSTVAEAMTFTDLLDRYDAQRVDLLQIDVEGFDVEILMKYEHDSLDALQQADAIGLLHGHGYDTFVEGEDTVAILRFGTTAGGGAS